MQIDQIRNFFTSSSDAAKRNASKEGGVKAEDAKEKSIQDRVEINQNTDEQGKQVSGSDELHFYKRIPANRSAVAEKEQVANNDAIALSKNAQVPAGAQQRIEEMQMNVSSGTYDSEQVINTVSGLIQEELGAKPPKQT